MFEVGPSSFGLGIVSDFAIPGSSNLLRAVFVSDKTFGVVRGVCVRVREYHFYLLRELTRFINTTPYHSTISLTDPNVTQVRDRSTRLTFVLSKMLNFTLRAVLAGLS